MSKIKIVLADDHDIVRNGIKQLLEKEQDIEVIGEASNGKEAIEVVEELKPDILVMDIGMPEMNGIEATAALKKKKSKAKILILSMFDVEDYVLKAVELGAYGYILKDAGKNKFLDAIREVYGGKRYYGHDISSFIIDNYLNTLGNKPVDKKTAQIDHNLSKRELEILKEVVSGHSNKKIAEDLDISVRTIETHRLKIMKKLKVSNVAEMVRTAIEGQLV